MVPVLGSVGGRGYSSIARTMLEMNFSSSDLYHPSRRQSTADSETRLHGAMTECVKTCVRDDSQTLIGNALVKSFHGSAYTLERNKSILSSSKV